MADSRADAVTKSLNMPAPYLRNVEVVRDQLNHATTRLDRALDAASVAVADAYERRNRNADRFTQVKADARKIRSAQRAAGAGIVTGAGR